MKDPIEERLERMRPASLRPALLERLLAAEPDPKVVRGPWPTANKVIRGPWLSWVGTVAASIVLGVVLWPVQPGPGSQVFTPMNSNSYLVSAADVGIVAPQPDHPFRLVHCVWLEDDGLRGNDGASTMRMTRAREQIVPVAMETF